jgi:geranylgeranyl pyrophosphate synthase
MTPGMAGAFARAWRAERTVIDKELRAILRRGPGVPLRLRRAMAHSLLGGGKRLRPILLLWTYDAFLKDGGRSARLRRAKVMPVACAFELIHTYSLIHDDLPAMDDDVLRRGRPTCHVAFDDATAILAGDALHALAFQILAEQGPPAICAIEELAAAAGPAGMVGGQLEDLVYESRPVTGARVLRIHGRKTARLIAAAMMVAQLAGAARTTVAEVSRAGTWLGLAFQAWDDLLDVIGTAAELGKTAGKDSLAGKPTWVRLEGTEAARRRTARYGRRGRCILDRLLPEGPRSEKLLSLAELMWNRRS